MSAPPTPADVLAGAARWCVVEAEALAALPGLGGGCIDALITDPPSGIAFMGASWDRSKGGRAQWVAWLAGILAEARRATRDGGRAVVWSLPRTAHWTACALEDAGWSAENKIYHLFGTGWPKGRSQLKPAAEEWHLARNGRSESLSIESCRVGTSKRTPGTLSNVSGLAGYGKRSGRKGQTLDDSGQNPTVGRYPPNLLLSHAPGCSCEGTRRVEGNGAHERHTLARPVTAAKGAERERVTVGVGDPDGMESVEAWRCVEGCPVAELDRQSGERTSGAMRAGTPRMNLQSYSGGFSPSSATERDIVGDTGTASRYFPQFPADDPDAPWNEALFRYVAKPSRAERNAGCEHLAEGPLRWSSGDLNPGSFQSPGTHRAANNHHPTVKPVELMRWFIRLVTRPDDVVLDTFAGSGTTGVAALLEGRRVILVEGGSDDSPAYAAIARARCAAADRSDWTRPVPVRAPVPPSEQGGQLALSFDSLNSGGSRGCL